jgi:hypothetical protein
MKRIIVLFGILAIIFAVCFSGCSAQNNIVITDSKSGETVAEFSSKEHQAEAAALTNALNGTGEVSGEIDYSEKYLVHFIDPKDPLYDIWYYAYLNDDSNAVYIQFDLEKMSNTKMICDAYNLMGIIIADESIEVVKSYYVGNNGYEQIAYSFLEKENKNSDYKKVVNLMSQMNTR